MISNLRIKVLNILSLTFLFVIQSHAAIKSLKMDTGRYIAYEANLTQTNKPTFVFLPGIYRGWTADDEFIKLLNKENINFVALHYSLQPESILKITKNEIAYVTGHNYTSIDLAQEVEFVLKKLRITKPIIVSLSYSSMISSILSQTLKYNPIIETAPMIRFDESNPSGGQVTEFWESFFNLNPFTGPIITQWYLKQTYQQYWSDTIDEMIKANPKDPKNKIRDLMIQSYTAMSMAAHGFDFTQQNFANGVQRLFILGHNEDATRYQLQQAAITQYERVSGFHKSTAVIPSAGHIVPADAPQDYVNILKTLIKK